jgi:hypothetical protein
MAYCRTIFQDKGFETDVKLLLRGNNSRPNIKNVWSSFVARDHPIPLYVTRSCFQKQDLVGKALRRTRLKQKGGTHYFLKFPLYCTVLKSS